MRGSGLVEWGTEVVYAFYTVNGAATRVRVSVDESDRLGAVEGLRVKLVLPGQEPVDGLVVQLRCEPPFVWIELLVLSSPIARRTG